MTFESWSERETKTEDAEIIHYWFWLWYKRRVCYTLLTTDLSWKQAAVKKVTKRRTRINNEVSEVFWANFETTNWASDSSHYSVSSVPSPPLSMAFAPTKIVTDVGMLFGAMPDQTICVARVKSFCWWIRAAWRESIRNKNPSKL